MKKMMKKLKSQAGETIAEVLIALLISTIALLMLATMINSSANSIQKSRDILESYYKSDWAVGSAELKVSFKDKDDNALRVYENGSAQTKTTTLNGKTILSYSKVDLTPAAGGTMP